MTRAFIIGNGPSIQKDDLTEDRIFPQDSIACNIEECFFEDYGSCLAKKIIITPQGCITDRDLIEE